MTIAAAVLLANGLYLLGIFNANPLGPRSGLIDYLVPGRLVGQPTIDPNVGFISQAVGHRAALDLLSGHLPWWNPYEGTGAPLAGGMQAAAFFPLTLLAWFSNGLVWEHVLLEILSGVATYLVLRRLAVGRVAATAAGVAFALNGTFAWFAHATVNPIAFLPLAVLGVEMAVGAAQEGRSGGWWLISIAGALSFYAGFPEVAYIDGLLVLCWFLWRFAGIGREHRRAFVSKGVAGVTVGVLLCAPLLIAMVDYFTHADLWLHTGGRFSHVYLPIGTLPQQVLPYAFGPILAFSDPKFTVYTAWVNVGGYLGSALLVLGVLGAASTGRRGLRIVLSLWIVFMVARTYGAPVVLGDVVNLLPGMANTAVFRYSAASVEFAAVVLAAFGIDALVAGQDSRRRLVSVAAAVFAVIGAAALVAHSLARQLGPVYTRYPYLAASVAWAIATVALIAAAGWLRRAPARAALAAAVLVADAFVLFVMPELSAPRGVSVDTRPAAYLRHHLGLQRFFTLGPLAPNYGAYYGLASLNAVDVPVPTAFQRYVNRRLDQAVDPTAFVGTGGGGALELLHNLGGYREAAVAYVLTPVRQALPTGKRFGLTLVQRTPTTWIYHLDGAASYMSAASPACSITATSRTSAQTTCVRSTLLIRRETDMPGWTAAIDGRATAIHRVDGIFQAVEVPAGVHRLTFTYSPPYAGWGGLALVLGVIGLLVPATYFRFARTGAPGPRTAPGPSTVLPGSRPAR